jgi:hypothetical protein
MEEIRDMLIWQIMDHENENPECGLPSGWVGDLKEWIDPDVSHLAAKRMYAAAKGDTEGEQMYGELLETTKFGRCAYMHEMVTDMGGRDTRAGTEDVDQAPQGEAMGENDMSRLASDSRIRQYILSAHDPDVDSLLGQMRKAGDRGDYRRAGLLKEQLLLTVWYRATQGHETPSCVHSVSPAYQN